MEVRGEGPGGARGGAGGAARAPPVQVYIFGEHGVGGFVGEGVSERTGYEPFAIHAPIQWAI